jgi:hypothetical protein
LLSWRFPFASFTIVSCDSGSGKVTVSSHLGGVQRSFVALLDSIWTPLEKKSRAEARRRGEENSAPLRKNGSVLSPNMGWAALIAENPGKAGG